jgi:ribokinase
MPDGSYGAVIVSGANQLFRPDAVAFPKRCDLLLLQSEIPDEANLFLGRRARSDGVRVVLNAAPARALPREMLGLVDLLVVNRGEAADLLAQDETTLDSVQAARHLRTMGAKAVIVTLGGEGLVLAEDGETCHHPAQPVQVVSTHGAGDAFIGALATEWARGAPLAKAAAYGQAAAALHVSLPNQARSSVDDVQIRARL